MFDILSFIFVIAFNVIGGGLLIYAFTLVATDFVYEEAVEVEEPEPTYAVAKVYNFSKFPTDI